MFRYLRIPVVCALLCLGAARAADGPVTLEGHIKPVLQQYCFDCHNAEKQKGDVNLVDLAKDANLEKNRGLWEKVVTSVEAGDMPPEKKPQLTSQNKDMLLHFLDGQLSKIDCTVEKNPGRVTARRLNREEFRNTIRDLLNVDFDPADFPNDEVGYGFDNIADVLSLSPMLLEKYLDAAEQIAQKAIITGPAKARVKQVKGRELYLAPPAGETTDDGALLFLAAGEAVRKLEFPARGEYKVRLRAAADQPRDGPPKLIVRVEDQEVGTIEVKATAKKPAYYQVIVPVEKPGWLKVSVALASDAPDRKVFLDSLDIEYPPGVASLPESHRRLVPKMPEPGQERAAAREYLAPFLKRAYRRPVTTAEIERVASFVDLALAQKGSFLEGMQIAVQAVLSSPQFLFRWELADAPLAPGATQTLSDYQVAARLSYFLWSSMPDEQLTQLAEQGTLLKNGNLEKQIARLLKDWRARALVTNFGGQWLQIRNIYEIAPDPEVFPKWDDNLRGMMKEETERFVEAIVKEDRPVTDLIDSDFTFLNEKLAKFYGIEGVRGGDFKRVTLPPGSPRGGVITQAAVLLTTSTPTRTSPVIRGKWILEQILGTPPPAPPANVPPLTEQKAVNQTASLRERFSEHSKNAECAGCHKRMDPLGFALENFSAIGEWREKDGKFPIDPSGKLADGRFFKNPQELKALLKQGNQFVANFAEKLMIYALGRGLQADDRCAIKTIVESANHNNNRFSALVTGIVLSDPFLKRQPAAPLAAN